MGRETRLRSSWTRQYNWCWDRDCFHGPTSNVFPKPHIHDWKKKRKKKSLDIYAIHGIENKEWGRETERAQIACGGHYFWCAPRLGELENIILSGWFDSAMKNVRSGDDKSWCWGEETGRQGMSFVMSAIWLHPLSSPLLSICLLIHISPFLLCFNFLLFYLSCVTALLFFYLDTISRLFFTLSSVIIWHTLAATLLFQIYPIFTLFWLSAHEERRKGWALFK